MTRLLCSYTPAVEHLQRALDLRQLMCGRDVSEGRKPRGQETEGKKRMRRGMEDREMVGESMLALGACYTQLGTLSFYYYYYYSYNIVLLLCFIIYSSDFLFSFIY